MKVLKWLVIALAVLILAGSISVNVAAALMPDEREFTNEIEIDAPPEVIWKVVTDRERYTEWQTQIDRVEIVDQNNWIEYPKNSPEPIKFRLERDERPLRMEVSYSMGDSMHGRWIGETTRTADGIVLRTVDSYRTDGVLTKLVMGAFFDMDRFAKDWNTKLKQRAEALNH